MYAMTPRLLVAAATMLAWTQCHAASSAWHRAHGADIRLVVTDEGADAGRLRGALEIRLAPGWKTYWLDPGDAGVPPSVSVAASRNLAGARLAFPAPTRFEDRYSSWAGYGAPVALPVEFDLELPGAPTLIAIDVFLGICEDICIPVQASFEIEPATGAHDPLAAAIVDAAFAALPAAASEGFGAFVSAEDEAGIVVDLVLPDGARPVDFFLASTALRSFGQPAPRGAGGEDGFVVPLHRPAIGAERAFYTLVTTAGSVSGELLLGR